MTKRKRLFAIGDLVTRTHRPEYGIGLITEYWSNFDYVIRWSGTGMVIIQGELFLNALENPSQ
jgi:hypothetical protein